MITSKLTDKSQTTVPQAVRKALGVVPGDALVYTIEKGGRVVISKAPDTETNTDDPFAAFDEWHSEIDGRAYRDL